MCGGTGDCPQYAKGFARGNRYRAALREATEALDTLWAAIGDRLHAGDLGLSKARLQALQTEVRQAHERAREVSGFEPETLGGE